MMQSKCKILLVNAVKAYGGMEVRLH